MAELSKLDLLIKMMKMTTAVGSDGGDNVALVALRKANEMLKAEGWDWEKLLRGKIVIVEDPFARVPTPPQPRDFGPRPTPPPPPPQPRPRPQAPPKPAWTPPPQPAPQPRPAFKPIAVVGGYDGSCYSCGTAVQAGHSWAIKFSQGGKFQKACQSCYANTMRRHGLAVQPQPSQNKWQRKANPKTIDDLINF